ncbi:MAG: hypothetical protein BWX80_01260 [Candidatus Hydrogenedentes bacterium ADurb.Bin101]|jgi:uncharacterized protein YdbL (DUF1318 family)|nr:MAG: hypothetical protein BWX80_01260 [Candidatus Hydrogenedentes bacterium ADurb.Bin101]HOC67655.1 DUF1318 domain-containing protein [Candidatus Hydrogenedentota bacterium]
MRKTVGMGVIAACIVSLGCVINKEHQTIPPLAQDLRHIAKQARQVLDYVEGKTDTLPGMAEAPQPVSRLNHFLNTIAPVQCAWAETRDAVFSPPMIEAVVRMRERNETVSALKRAGCLGESSRGLVELRECDTTRDAEEMNASQKTVAEENKDRTLLYNEIARLNKDLPEVNVAKIQSIYAMERLRRSHPGEAFQLPSGTDFDTIKATSLGRKLGGECISGAWVTIP